MRSNTVLALLSLLLLGVSGQTQCSVDPTHRVDCFPQADANQQGCQQRGCCWVGADSTGSDKPSVAMGQPECFFPSDFGYAASDVVKTGSFVNATLTRSSSTPPSPYGGDISTLHLSVFYETETVVRVKVTDPANARWEVPLDTPGSAQTGGVSPSDAEYVVNLQSSPFSLVVTRKSDGTPLLNTTLGGLIYSDQFIQWSTGLASSNVYGLGEHVAPLALSTDWTTIPLYARDQGTPDGIQHNLYGVHPLALVVEPSGNSHGLFWLNSNAQEFILQPAPGLTYRTIGGILDVRVIVGDGSPDSVTRAYTTQVVGTPYLPPYWALGFHLCRWGYESIEELRNVSNGMIEAGLPYDVQWTDVDAMDKHLDFTYDPNAFHGLPDFVNDLKADGRHYISIIDPGISNRQPAGTYPSYDSGIKMDVWVKDNGGVDPWQGSVWPGWCVFPDFFHPNATTWWTESLQAFHDVVPVDSLWIDMNEIALTGPFEACGDNQWTNPPYMPAIEGASLTQKTMCTDAITSLGRAYNVHSLYGYSEMKATMAALRSIRKGKRSIVISRSTFAGSGPYGSHWLGDNTASWDDLALSIPGVMNFNIFGIPFVGADVCGFGGNTTMELCVRWMQAASLLPFYRNHNSIGQARQDPPVFGPAAADMMKTAMEWRYTLLPHLYTLLFDAHTSGSTVTRPLFFEFPTDSNTFAVDSQYLLGPSVLVTPVLTESATTVSGYFPAAQWYSLYDGSLTTSGGKTITLNASLDTLQVHVRGGYIVPTQASALTTTAQRESSTYGLIVALDGKGVAEGFVVVDDGETENPPVTETVFAAQSTSSTSTLKVSPQKTGYTPPTGLDTMRVFGVMQASVTKVTVNDSPLESSSFSFDATTKVLEVSGLKLSLTDSATITWGN